MRRFISLFSVIILTLFCFNACSDKESAAISDLKVIAESSMLDEEYESCDSNSESIPDSLSFLSDVDKKKAEWYFAYLSKNSNSETVVIKVKDSGYLNTARLLLDSHLETRIAEAAAISPYNLPEGEAFACGQYAVLLVGAAREDKNMIISYITTGSTQYRTTTSPYPQDENAEIVSVAPTTAVHTVLY